jgi:hypothetical protein
LLKRSKDAPLITIQQQAFIEASIRAAEEAQKRDAALQWRAKAWTIAAAAIFAIGAAVAGVAWWQEKKTVDNLRAANLRRCHPRTRICISPDWGRNFNCERHCRDQRGLGETEMILLVILFDPC